MPPRRDRYRLVRGNVTEKNPHMTDEGIHARTKFLLARDGRYCNWHHADDVAGGWEFPIDGNLSIRLEPGSLENSFYVSLRDKLYYNPSGDPDTHLAFLTDVKLRDAKLIAFGLACEHLYNNTIHFRKAWEKLERATRTKTKPYRDALRSVKTADGAPLNP